MEGWRPTGVLFDLDNTLWDRDHAFRCWATDLILQHLADLPSEQCNAAIEYLVALDTNGSKAATFTAFTAAYPGINLSITQLITTYHTQILSYTTLDPEHGKLLDHLDQRGLPFGIVTNGAHHQLRIIHALGLDTKATCVLVSGIYGQRKPGAGIFADAAVRLGVEPTNILFVGDDPIADIWGAHRMGMRTAWIRRGQEWPASLPTVCADLVVDNLAELSHLLCSVSPILLDGPGG